MEILHLEKIQGRRKPSILKQSQSQLQLTLTASSTSDSVIALTTRGVKPFNDFPPCKMLCFTRSSMSMEHEDRS
jgi:hypothetical protein